MMADKTSRWNGANGKLIGNAMRLHQTMIAAHSSVAAPISDPLPLPTSGALRYTRPELGGKCKSATPYIGSLWMA